MKPDGSCGSEEAPEGLLFELFLAPLGRFGLSRFRSLIAGGAQGRTLELGAGTGANLGLYGAEVSELVLSDIQVSRLLLRKACRRGLPPPLRADAMSLPFPDASFDTVVSTLLFCSVPEPRLAFSEISRVLKPGGEWRFVEHVLPGPPLLARLARSLTPAWRRLAGGCHLDRDTLADIRRTGFDVRLIDSSLREALVAGVARPRAPSAAV